MLEKKETSSCMSHLLCPSDSRVQKKEQEKMKHYKDLNSGNLKHEGFQLVLKLYRNSSDTHKETPFCFFIHLRSHLTSFVSMFLFVLFCFWSVYNIVVVLT